MYHNFFIHSSVDGHLGCFHLLAIVNSAAMGYYITLIRMAINKNSTNNKCWGGCGEKGTLLYYWCKYKLIQPLWKTVWRFLKKLGINLPYDLAIPLLGIYLAASKSLQSHRTLCNPIDGSPLGSSVPRILQARILEWVAISFSNIP